MNKVQIIGNLVRDPETRTTQSGITVCSFTVAVNRRRREGHEPEADFFRVSAWRQLGENCQKYLAKGRKVAVSGSVSVSAYKDSSGQARAQLEVTADDVEFLTPKGEAAAQYEPPTPNAVTSAPSGYVEVDEDELPF